MTGDRELRDEALEGEIELVGALVLAAAASEGPMLQEQIDELLGVVPLATAPEGLAPPVPPETGCAPATRLQPCGPSL
ncbi:MAG: hypothetical protein ABIU87_08780 [Ornithinibacter sp.]